MLFNTWTFISKQFDIVTYQFYSSLVLQGRVVQRPISANPGLNLNPSLFFFSSKEFSRNIFSIPFGVAYHHIADKKN